MLLELTSTFADWERTFAKIPIRAPKSSTFNKKRLNYGISIFQTLLLLLLIKHF